MTPTICPKTEATNKEIPPKFMPHVGNGGMSGFFPRQTRRPTKQTPGQTSEEKQVDNIGGFR